MQGSMYAALKCCAPAVCLMRRGGLFCSRVLKGVPHDFKEDELADWEEAAGISAPLYEIVDTLFELQSRGFFRRQVRQHAAFMMGSCPILSFSA